MCPKVALLAIVTAIASISPTAAPASKQGVGHRALDVRTDALDRHDRLERRAIPRAATARATGPVFLYWANNTPGWGGRPAATTIGRARLDGTGVERSFVSGAGRRPCGVAVDREHIYWGELQGGAVGSPDIGGAIGRANRDGSGVDARFIPGHGCGVVVAGGYIYWATGAAIARANTDGTEVDLQFIPGLATALGGSSCVAVAGRHVYWGSWDEATPQRTIGRANIDGTGVERRFITGVADPCPIAVAGNHIYWTGQRDDAGTIGRANLDGSGVDQRFVRHAGGACGLAVYKGHIYWAKSAGGLAHPRMTIVRANLDGSAVTDPFITGIHDACNGLAVG
jgi:hypothetical protein